MSTSDSRAIYREQMQCCLWSELGLGLVSGDCMALPGRRGTDSRSTQGSLGPSGYFVLIRPSIRSTEDRDHLVNSYPEPSHNMESTHSLEKEGSLGLFRKAPKSLVTAVWTG